MTAQNCAINKPKPTSVGFLMEESMATLATNVSFQCLGLDGKPLAGGKIYTYEAGTTTPKSTFTTMAGDVPNLNPVILDQNGKAKIFLGDGSYRLQIKDSNDALIDDIDQISRYVTQSEFATFQQTVNDGVSQLTEVREQIDVFVNTSIGNQKGFANGIAPLDANIKVDPIYLPALPNTAIPKATETALGVVELATQAETNTGTDDERAVTPATLKNTIPTQTKSALNASGDAPIYACRAWVNFSGAGIVAIKASGNVSSITDNGTGDYTVNFSTAMPNTNYAATHACDSIAAFTYERSRTVSSIRVGTKIDDQGAPDPANFPLIIMV